MAKTVPSLVLTPVARLVTFHGILEKTEYDPKTKKSVVSGSDKARYNATFLIPKTENLDAVKAAMVQAGKNRNPEVPFADWRKALKDGNRIIERALKKNPEKSEARLAFYKDMWVIESKSTFAPDLSKAVNGKAVEVPVEMADKEFYSGCYVKAELNFVANEIEDGDDTKRYISAYHNFIVKVKDGERLGRKSRDDVFKGALGGVSDQKLDTDDVAF